MYGKTFYALTGSTGRVGTMTTDASQINAHRSGGRKSGLPAGWSAAREADAQANPSADRGSWTS